MGHKIYIAYEEAQSRQTPRGKFYEGLFAGGMGFATSIGGWLVSLLCWLGLETRISGVLAITLSVCVGVAFGRYMARESPIKEEESCKTK